MCMLELHVISTSGPGVSYDWDVICACAHLSIMARCQLYVPLSSKTIEARAEASFLPATHTQEKNWMGSPPKTTTNKQNKNKHIVSLSLNDSLLLAV